MNHIEHNLINKKRIKSHILKINIFLEISPYFIETTVAIIYPLSITSTQYTASEEPVRRLSKSEKVLYASSFPSLRSVTIRTDWLRA